MATTAATRGGDGMRRAGRGDSVSRCVTPACVAGLGCVCRDGLCFGAVFAVMLRSCAVFRGSVCGDVWGLYCCLGAVFVVMFGDCVCGAVAVFGDVWGLCLR